MTAPEPARVVFFLDCDNTLLDNDALKDDIADRLRTLLGDALAGQFWQDYEAVRQDEDAVDLPATFDRFRADCPDADLFERAHAVVMDYPFAERLFPTTLATLAYLNTIATPVILSDGDAVYQPRKIERSGLAAAVGGRVAVYTHKEEHLDDVMARWPAPYYVAVDDKARILADFKSRYPQRFVTVQILQGHYAHSGEIFSPAPDLELPDAGDLRAIPLARFTALLASS